MTKTDARVVAALHHQLALYNAIHTERLRNTALGHWVNEAFVVRLFSVLESHCVVGNDKRIDKSLDGAPWVDLCRRLRHQIAHATAEISDRDTVRLDQKLRELANIPELASLFAGKFVLAKDTVLRPMHRACVSYCSALLAKEALDAHAL
jgi:hypothetical protein